MSCYHLDSWSTLFNNPLIQHENVPFDLPLSSRVGRLREEEPHRGVRSLLLHSEKDKHDHKARVAFQCGSTHRKEGFVYRV